MKKLILKLFATVFTFLCFPVIFPVAWFVRWVECLSCSLMHLERGIELPLVLLFYAVTAPVITFVETMEVFVLEFHDFWREN